MNKLKIVFLGILFLTIVPMQAQVSINVNFGAPPVWAPSNRIAVQYYYLPDIDAYYDVPAQRFIYIKNGKWFRSSSLPYQYRNYHLRGGNVVYLTDYRGNSPYLFHSKHREKYHGNNPIPNRNVGNGNNGNSGGNGRVDNGGGHGKGKKHKG
jgi:hypothetical protein